ncbi:uncharacterized protein [Pyxicephalus adspersus]|uniref:uncharacterized protein isoform X2 n=1 Tax=Pyxicephalus adspersus TaxID=30357 RepID=UPI003B598E35
MPAPLSLLSLLGSGSQGVVVAGGTHAAENLKLVARRLQGECFRSSCPFHWCMKAFTHLFTDSTREEKPDRRDRKGKVQKTKTTAHLHENPCKKSHLIQKDVRHTLIHYRYDIIGKRRIHGLLVLF